MDKAILANAEFLKQIIADPEIFGHDVDDLAHPNDTPMEFQTDDPFVHAHSHEPGLL